MFADMYKPHLSGVTNYISLYKERFEHLGHEVFVLTYGNRDYVDHESNVVRSPAIAWGTTGWQMGLGVSEQAREVMHSLDIAHTHHPFLSGRVALRECGSRGIPVVFTNHTRYDIYSDAYAGFLPRRLRMAFLKRYLSGFATDADLVLAPSVGIKQWLADFGITDSAVEHSNAVDTQPFISPSAPKSRSEFGFSPDSVVLCYLGRIGPEKNFDLLVEAFIRAAEADSRLCLLVIGDGPGRGQAHEKLWAHGLMDRVHFNGKTPYTDVPNVIAAADVFVTASVSEVHPLVVMEAMAAGLPAIGIHSPGVGDIINDGVTGLLTNESVTEFSAALTRIARDSAEREAFASAARTAAAGYDIRIMADRMLELYEGLLKG